MAEASSTEDVITLRIRFKSETFEKFAERYAADLTRDEIFIRAREPLPVGTPLAFDFSLNDGTPLIAGRGAVSWSRGPEEAQGAPTGMAIHFEAMTDRSHQMLGRILEAKARLAGTAAVPPAAAPERGEPARAPRQPANQPNRPLPGAGSGQPSRQEPDVFFDDGDQERTELAQVPSFFHEGSEQGSEAEKTRLQDPRLSAALFNRALADDDDDDVTNVRATASMYNRPAMNAAAATTVETRPPPWDESPPPVDESSFRLPEDHRSLVIPSTTEPIPADPGLSWRPLASPPTASMSPPPMPSPPPAQSILDRELFAGLEPGSGTSEPRWSTAGPGGIPAPMMIAPAFPPAMLDPLDPNVMATPAWQVPAVDPGARARVQQSAEDEPPKTRLASLKMWAALTLAAGGIVAAALLLLPTLLRPSSPVGEISPEETLGSPAESVPPVPDPAAAARPTGSAVAPAAPAPGATLEGVNTPSPSAAESAPTSGSAAPSAPTPPPAAALKATDPPPAATPPRPAQPRFEELQERPGRARGARRPTIADRTAPGEINADPTPPIAAPAGIQADGSQEVYWLTVRSVPAGADVLIDGQVEGTTPFVRRIFDPTRNYTISVRRAGFEPHERTLGASDQWTRRGSVRTLTVLAKLNPASGAPVETQPPPVAPSRLQEPSNPPTPAPPPVAPPAVESDRKTNPFAEPASPGGTQPQ